MQFIIENHKIYAQNEAGERLAEVDFPALDENTVSIDHTFVDPSLRGQGVAATLMKMTIEELRRSGRKPCPFAPLHKNGLTHTQSKRIYLSTNPYRIKRSCYKTPLHKNCKKAWFRADIRPH